MSAFSQISQKLKIMKLRRPYFLLTLTKKFNLSTWGHIRPSSSRIGRIWKLSSRRARDTDPSIWQFLGFKVLPFKNDDFRFCYKKTHFSTLLGNFDGQNRFRIIFRDIWCFWNNFVKIRKIDFFEGYG